MIQLHLKHLTYWSYPRKLQSKMTKLAESKKRIVQVVLEIFGSHLVIVVSKSVCGNDIACERAPHVLKLYYLFIFLVLCDLATDSANPFLNNGFLTNNCSP
jgi:hypothetical protein